MCANVSFLFSYDVVLCVRVGTMVKVFGQCLWSGSWLVVQLVEWLVLWWGILSGVWVVIWLVVWSWFSVRLGGLVVVKVWLGTG